MNPSSVVDRPAPRAALDFGAQIVRYEALFALTSRLTNAETVQECAAAAATGLKHVAGVRAWRIIVEREQGFLTVDGSRGPPQVTERLDLEPWDQLRWAAGRPESMAVATCPPGEGAPAHLVEGGTGQVFTLPYEHPGQPRALLLAASQADVFSAVDLKFLRMAGSQLCNQVGTVILRRRLIQALQDQAWRDGLTGLPNRRAILEMLDKQLANANRYGLPLTVIVADIDHFKSINDTLGHPAGDEALRETARRLVALTREGDSVGRYDGEEFLFVCNLCSADDLLIAGERIRKGIASRPFVLNVNGQTIERLVTLSLGAISVQGRRDARRDDLIQRADEALYLAKHSGRNRLGVSVDGHLAILSPSEPATPGKKENA